MIAFNENTHYSGNRFLAQRLEDLKKSLDYESQEFFNLFRKEITSTQDLVNNIKRWIVTVKCLKGDTFIS